MADHSDGPDPEAGFHLVRADGHQRIDHETYPLSPEAQQLAAQFVHNDFWRRSARRSALAAVLAWATTLVIAILDLTEDFRQPRIALVVLAVAGLAVCLESCRQVRKPL